MTGKAVQETLNVGGTDISVRSQNGDDYVSLTDLARLKVSAEDDPSVAIQNWMRNRNTIEFLGVWEQLNNPDFKPLEFEGFKKQAGLNSFVMTPTKWIKATNAKGIQVRRGRYGSGTFARVDIALDFAAWISPEFRLYVYREYQRLKTDEHSRLNKEWQDKRLFASLNYRINTDAIKEQLPEDASKKFAGKTYAKEAELLNFVVFGQTSKQWKDRHPDLQGNMRDYASVTQNLILSNMESLNAMLIKQHKSQRERYEILWKAARSQEKTFEHHPTVRKIEDAERPSNEINRRGTSSTE